MRQIELSLMPWIASPKNVIRKMLSIAEIGEEDVVCDLGSGDARILMIAVEEFKAKKTIGYELRAYLYQDSLREIEKRNLSDRIQVLKRNLYDADLSQVTVVTLYLSNQANKLLRPKLEKELRDGARVVSLTFKVNGWRITHNGHHSCINTPTLYGQYYPYYPIYLYTIPDAFQ